MNLKQHNTFGISAMARDFAEVHSVEQLINLLQSVPNKEDILFIGGGSNILISTNFVDKWVIKLSIKGKKILEETPEHIIIEAACGENLHNFILWTLENNYGGMENLSLIPGNIGTAPIQNIGAYGVEIKDVLQHCTVIDLNTLQQKTFSLEDCKLGYRDSVFKNQYKGKYVIISVAVKLSKTNHKLNIEYGDIQKELQSMQITAPTIKDVSNAVIKIRSSKLPDTKVLGNGGSFFKNPVVDKVHFDSFIQKYPQAPYYKISNNEYKIPAGWLIETAGYKGYRIKDAGVHHLQALVLVNYGNATGEEILSLSEEIIQKVQALFGITIEREVNIIG